MEGEVIFKDIRRYYCDICGICRSNKSLIRSHMLSEHKSENWDHLALDELFSCKRHQNSFSLKYPYGLNWRKKFDKIHAGWLCDQEMQRGRWIGF
ncbi:hypothetical protein AMTRI_Chr10g8620 [Amborella trichopoda]